MLHVCYCRGRMEGGEMWLVSSISNVALQTTFSCDLKFAQQQLLVGGYQTMTSSLPITEELYHRTDATLYFDTLRT